MAEQGEKTNLFEGVDFSSLADELMEVASKEEVIEEKTDDIDDVIGTPPIEEKIEEDTGDSTEDTTGDSQENNLDDSKEDASPDETKDNSSPLYPYAKLLADEGILPNLNLAEFKGEASELIDAMQSRIDEGVNYYKGNLPQEIKTLVDNWEEGVPLSTLLEIDQKRTEYKSIPENKISENKDLQKSLLQEYYKQTTKFSDDKINKLIQTADDLDTLGEDAVEAHKDLIKLQDAYEAEAASQAKKEREDYEKAQEQKLEDFKKTLESTNEVIPGLNISKALKDEIFKTMTTPVAQDAYGNPLNEVSKYATENPYKFDIMLNYLFKVTSQFSDWSVFKASGKKSAIEEFERATQKQNTQTKGSTPSNPKSDNFDKDALFKELEKFKD